MPKFIECEQGSDVWLKARIGRITASRLADVLSTRKDGKEAAPRANYRQELVAERLTGTSTDHFVSKDMIGALQTRIWPALPMSSLSISCWTR